MKIMRERLYHFLKPDYFSNRSERIVFEEIEKFMDKYNALPTQETLTIEVDGRKDLNDEEYKKVVGIISTLDKTEVDLQWLHDQTEKFCKDKAIYNAVVEGINIIDGNKKIKLQMRYLLFYQISLQFRLTYL